MAKNVSEFPIARVLNDKNIKMENNSMSFLGFPNISKITSVVVKNLIENTLHFPCRHIKKIFSVEEWNRAGCKTNNVTLAII